MTPEELNGLSLALLSLAVLAFVVLTKMVFDFKKEVLSRANALQDRVSVVNRDAASLKILLEEIRQDAEEKIDYDYLDKRIDGLISLLNKPK